MKKVQVVMLAFLLAFGSMFVGCGDESPSDVVKQFYAAAKKGDEKKLREVSTGKTVELLIMFMKDESYKKQMTSSGDMTIVEETINGDKATVKVTYQQDGKEKKEDYMLVKEDGKWKVTLGK